MTQNIEATVAVTQADRLRALEILGGAAPDGLLDGRKDSLTLIQGLARHRLAAEQSCALAPEAGAVEVRTRRLVIAARRAVYEMPDCLNEEIMVELDQAVEQFSSDIAWEDSPDVAETPATEQSRASTPAVGREALGDAVDFLRHYARFIQHDVKADDLERHPYLPAIEQAADDLATIIALSPPATDDAIAAKDAEIARLREALEPFALYADAILKRRDGQQEEPVAVDRLVFGMDGQHVTIGDLRKVRAALAPSTDRGEAK